jgi:hypothetical protein
MASMRSRVRTPSAPPLIPFLTRIRDGSVPSTPTDSRSPPARFTKKRTIGNAKLGNPDAVRTLGMYRGSVLVADDFNAPLLPELRAFFLG